MWKKRCNFAVVFNNKDMNAIGKTKGVARYIVLDVAVVTVACLIPAMSHVTALPLYMLNPMLALLLVGMLFGGRLYSSTTALLRNSRRPCLQRSQAARRSALPYVGEEPRGGGQSGMWNALVLAVLMPLVSCLVVGVPTVGKMVCMVAELATVAGLFQLLSRRWAVLPSVLVSILAAKVVYYAFKAVIIAPDVLIGTAWWMQLGAVLLWGGLFAALYRKVVK